jgi:septum formation inhibitor MinC
MLRGTAGGLEFVFSDGEFEETAHALRSRIGERPDFYRGSAASLILHGGPPDEAAVAAFLESMRGYGIEVRGLYGTDAVAALAVRHGIAYLGEPVRPQPAPISSIDRRRTVPAAPPPPLTDAARSLDADFAGARADLAARRSRRTVRVSPAYVRPAALHAAVPVDAVATRYYRGTLRGGQSLQQVGHIVVVGDVNPGAELVATGDIVVFGALLGTAHAGAQGDRAARVAALELAPTQLRIATAIAAGDGSRRGLPEEARIEGDRIVIAALSDLRR